MDASGKRIAIVVSRWNEIVTKELLEGSLDELRRMGEPEVQVIHVPGTWEIPPVVAKLLESDKKPDGVICLGCILQGQTPHAKLLGSDVAGALMGLQVQYRTPIGWGVLTPDTMEQAVERSGMKLGNKGREAAQATVELISVLEQL
jgi:6,7-dimethyl-8-ribityllumazine synthase